jgi:class 3 adenylate cyclase
MRIRPPETHYAKSGDVHIAYQVVGDGHLDLVCVPGFISHVEHVWEEPHWASFLERLASFARLICFDKRGTGLSDRVGDIPTLEQRMDDVRAVMDAVGSEQAALFGLSEGGPMSVLFAASHPDRTRALVLCGSYALFSSAVMSPDQLEGYVQQVDRSWGSGASVARLAPSLANDPAFLAWFRRFERLGGSPSAVIALMRMNSQIDIRHILPSIRVPTLVLHRTGDLRVNVAAGRFLADNIPGARYIELPGSDHLFCVGDTKRLLDEIEEFLTGARASADADRVLATVLFTDIVGSTSRAAELGDREWRRMLESHDARIRRELERHRGRKIKSTGDGVLATFDGPARGVRCAAAIGEAMAALGLRVRSGLHTGEVELLGDDIGGIAVHLAARVAGMAGAGEVLVSGVVKDLVAGSGLKFRDRGVHALKGLPEDVHIYAVEATA